MIAWSELKERKLAQWAVAYVAGAWALLQMADLLSDAYAWPPMVMRALPLLLVVGFFAALVLAWFHGEKGAQRVSAMEVGMLAALFVIAGAAVAWTRGSATTPGESDTHPVGTSPVEASPAGADATAALAHVAEQGSIAVLPFVNMSSDPEQEFFSDGISGELLNVLAQLPELRVVSRTSAFSFKGKDVTVDSIARALNVRHVLEGSVRKAGDRVRITAQLIDASTGYHVWSDTYDRNLADIFTIQDEISRDIVGQLQIELAGDRGREPLARVATTDPEAHAMVLRAREMVVQGSGDPRAFVTRAEALFEEAIARDSSYAAAWAGLANVARIQAQFGLVPPDEGFEQARLWAERALELDPDEGEAHIVLATAEWHGADVEAAEPHLQRAVRAKPNDARILSFYSRWLLGSGRLTEAMRLARRAVELDPLSHQALSAAALAARYAWDLEAAAESYERALVLAEAPLIVSELGMVRVLLGQREEAVRLADRLIEIAPQSGAMLEYAGWIYAYSRDFPRATELFRRAAEAEPDHGSAPAALANALVMVEEFDEAIRVAERAVDLAPDIVALQVIRAYVYAKAGRTAEAERALEELPDDDTVGRAAVHTALGHTDRAFDLLERAFEDREPGLVELGADWWFDELRGDPRMDRLLERVGVPDVASQYGLQSG